MWVSLGIPRDLEARRCLSRCLSLCRRRRGNLAWALTRQFVGVQKDPYEDDNMQAFGVSRFDVSFGPGWRVWTNVEGGVRETLELSSRDRMAYGVLGEALQVGVCLGAEVDPGGRKGR